jgi:nitrite reductase/ring-hydroxylating ferredoxin subunit
MEHCKYCNKECKNKRSLAQHELRCKCNPNKIVIVNNLANYNKKVKNGELERLANNNTIHKILYCKYCNKKCTSENSLVQHEIRCSCNPNKIDTTNGNCNITEYNKKVKNGEIEKLNTNQYTKAKNNGTTYIISDDTRLKISEASKITNKNY